MKREDTILSLFQCDSKKLVIKKIDMDHIESVLTSFSVFCHLWANFRPKISQFRHNICICVFITTFTMFNFTIISLFFIADTPHVSVYRSVNTQENDNAQLNCDYKSSSAAKVTWIRKNQILISGPEANNELDSKYQLFFASKDNQNRSTLVINNVANPDLGEYVCLVQNAVGDGNATIQLTYEPGTPILEDTHIHGDVVTTQWRIKSWQSLSEVMLKYQQKGVS